MKNVVYVENVQVRTTKKFSTTCWLHDVGLYFLPDVCLTNWTFWVFSTSTTVAKNCQMSAWQKHDRSFRLKALFTQTHLLEVFEFLSSTFILKCAGWPTISFDVDGRSLFCDSATDVEDKLFTFWRARILSSKFVRLESCVVIFNLFKKSSSNFFITEIHHFCFSYKWRRSDFFIYSPFQFSSLFSWVKNLWEFVRRRQKPEPGSSLGCVCNKRTCRIYGGRSIQVWKSIENVYNELRSLLLKKLLTYRKPLGMFEPRVVESRPIL